MSWSDPVVTAVPCGRCGRHLNDIEIKNCERRAYRTPRPERKTWCVDCCEVEDELEKLTEPRYNLERDHRGALVPEAVEVVYEFLEDLDRGRYRNLSQVSRMLGVSDSNIGRLYRKMKQERVA